MATDPDALLDRWDWNGPARTEVTADAGLINTTLLVTVDGRARAVLQRLNTGIFDPVVHEDIEAVTAHLAAKGVPTTRLIPTREGRLWFEDPSGGVWRALTLVGDCTLHRLGHPGQARSAAALLGRFHRAVADLDWSFRSRRLGVHDTVAHMRGLARAVQAHGSHRLAPKVAPLAAEIAARWEAWHGPADLPERVIHGDPKVSNVRFDGDTAVALIDLDTLGRGTLDVELGDALRSWCNVATEDEPGARVDLELFRATVEGYAEGAGDAVSDPEWRAVVPGWERIALELSARFLRDALEERYFGWDPRHGGRGEHNLLRATGQLDLARKVAAVRDEAQALVDIVRR